ncbi:MAG: helicase-associated domain-containing protein, partial [Anaerolineae bacterium]
MPRLRESLLDTPLVRLRVIADFWEVQLTRSRQREVALELAEVLADRDAVQRARERLSDDQAQALQAVLAVHGHMPQRVFAREWGEIRGMGPGRMERERPWEDPISPAEGLWYHGFVYQTFEHGPDGAYDAIHVPVELSRHLPTPEAVQPHSALDPVSTPDAVFSCGDQLLDDACLLAAYVHNERPQVGPERGWPRRHEQRILPRLRDHNRERFLFLRHLASRAGWLIDDETGRLRLDPQAVTTWLEGSTSQQRSTLAGTWSEDSTWNDLFHVPSLEPEDTGAWRNDPVLARQAVLRHLRSCEPATWYGIDSFVRAIKQVDPDFQRPAGDYDSWYIRDRESGAYLSGFESWDAVEGRLIRYLLTKPLTWLGLIDLGADGDDCPPHAFRLSPHGAAFLHLIDPPPGSPPAPARLLSGFRVTVDHRRRYHHFQLARVADWVQTGDRFVYRVTPASLERGHEQGIAVARVLEFLEEITEAPLPRAMEEALNRWEARGTQVRLERGVVLTVSSEELMDQIMASPRLARLIRDRVGPSAALVREQDWPQV